MKKSSSESAIFRVSFMRRLSIALLPLAIMASTAATAPAVVAKTSGGAAIELMHGAGFAGVRNQGTFFGRVKRGRIVATSNVNVKGCESRRDGAGNTVRCKGTDLTFNTFGADKWWLRLHGHGIDGSGIVHGCLVLDGRDSGPTGSFRRGQDGEWHAWPRSRTAYTLGTGAC
jgi:hypothetical protein